MVGVKIAAATKRNIPPLTTAKVQRLMSMMILLPGVTGIGGPDGSGRFMTTS
jgi:hypothetical protein